MRNKFAGTCYRCGKTVEAGDGHFERKHRKWRIQHASCAIKWRGTNHSFSQDQKSQIEERSDTADPEAKSLPDTYLIRFIARENHT